eukprot:7749988-Ditylum_brightwellii.AAC.1
MGPSAFRVEVEGGSMVKNCGLVTPTIDDIRDCSDAGELGALAIPDQRGAVTYPGCACFIPAPFLRDAIINAESNDPFEIIPMVFLIAKDFDDKNGSGDATQHSEDFALWAWGVRHGKVTETRFELNPDDGEIANFCEERHAECITQSLAAVQASTP